MLTSDEIPLSAIKVKRPCLLCYPNESLGTVEIMLVSPSGVVHYCVDSGMTECGHEASGDGWWWKL